MTHPSPARTSTAQGVHAQSAQNSEQAAAKRKGHPSKPQAGHAGDGLAPPLSRQLQATARVVQAVRAGRSLTAELAHIPPDMRPGVQALTFQVMRQMGRAMALRERLANKAPSAAVDALLCTALALSWQQEAAPYPVHTLVNQAVEAARQQRQTQAQSGFINACLRRFLREREVLVAETDKDPLARWNHPRWWVARLQQEYPDDWQKLLEMAQQPAPMSLRVDARHHSVTEYQSRLQAMGWIAKQVGESGLQLERAVPVHHLPGFELGHVSVQDAAAQVAAPLLLQGLDTERPWRILDACAAPGGKTGHLLACYPNAQVLALDVDAARCQRIEDNLQRLGEQAQIRAQVRAADAAQPAQWWDGVAFDAILLDAPCTASGIVRRHPDVRWLRRPDDSAQLALTQAKLLQALWPLLAPGGRLLYCTCSVFHAEGDDTVQAFLQSNTDAQMLPSPGHLIPGKLPMGLPVKHNALGEHDGFYYALLEKSRD
jgi:16S rRNA (cytosine967-C5)-methyltransferase